MGKTVRRGGDELASNQKNKRDLQKSRQSRNNKRYSEEECRGTE